MNNQEIEEAKGDESPRLAIDPSHVARTEPEEKKPEAAPVQAAASTQSVDAALIKEIWPYVRCSQRCPGAGMIAHEGRDIAQELR